MEELSITCSTDGMLSIKCSMYHTSDLIKAITKMRNDAIVDDARCQISETGSVNLSQIGKKHNIFPSTVLAILKAKGYSKTTTTTI